MTEGLFPECDPRDAASRDSENQYRRLVEMSPDIVLLCDADGRVVYINLAGLELLGFDERGQLLGRRFEEIVHDDSRADICARLAALFEEGRDLPFVEERFLRADGSITTYTAKNAPPAPSGTPWRKMDCSDCHNRTPHKYETAEDVVDNLILEGRLGSRLPQLKKASLAALVAKYSSREAARHGIHAGLSSFYRGDGEEVARVAKVLYQEAYAPNIYPHLRIDWSTNPDHAGHRRDLGCFRCHDGEHETGEGRALAQDCGMCHSILVSGSRQSEIEPKVRDLLF